MKTYITLLLLFISSIIYSQDNYTITQGSKTLTWSGKAAVGGYAPEGTLQIRKATAVYHDNTLQSLEITVDMTSLYQENKRLMGHLRDKDFFHVKKYKTATFVLTEAINTDTTTNTLVGYMTIKDTKHKENVKATISIQGDTITITFDHKMDRTVYGVTYNSPSIFKSIKENAIADDFTLKGTLVFTKNNI